MAEVSVIMGVYNTEFSVLKMAVESILSQSFPDIELIICDDGSSNGCYFFLESLQKIDKRIILLRNSKNMRASIARNKCIQLATGDFIAIMDADDWSHPMRLEKQLSFLITNPKYDFVGTRGCYFFNKIGDLSDTYPFYVFPNKKNFLVTLPFVHASIMFRRTVLDQTNGYNESKLVNRSEDYDLLMRAYQRGFVGANLDNELYYIRLDKNTYKRRKYRFRINESIVKWNGFSKLGLMPLGILFAIKPLIVGLIPSEILKYIKKGIYRSVK